MTGTLANSTAVATTRPIRWISGPFQARTWTRTAHLILNLPIACVAFTIAATVVSASAGLLVTVIGIPLLAASLWLAVGYGRLERARARLLLDVAVPAPAPVTLSWQPSSWLATLRRGSAWKALAHAVIALPVAVVTFTVVVTGWATAAACVTSPLTRIWSNQDPHLGSFHLDSPAGLAGTVLIGVLITLAMPPVVRGLAAVDTALTRHLLGRSG